MIAVPREEPNPAEGSAGVQASRFLPTRRRGFSRAFRAGSSRGRTGPRPVPGESPPPGRAPPAPWLECPSWGQKSGRAGLLLSGTDRGAQAPGRRLLPGPGVGLLGPALTLCSCVTSGQLLSDSATSGNCRTLGTISQERAFRALSTSLGHGSVLNVTCYY